MKWCFPDIGIRYKTSFTAGIKLTKLTVGKQLQLGLVADINDEPKPPDHASSYIIVQEEPVLST